MSEPQYPCPHGRPHWGICPWCLGLNGNVAPVEPATINCCSLDVQMRGNNMVALTCHCGAPCAYESGLCARCGAKEG